MEWLDLFLNRIHNPHLHCQAIVLAQCSLIHKTQWAGLYSNMLSPFVFNLRSYRLKQSSLVSNSVIHCFSSAIMPVGWTNTASYERVAHRHAHRKRERGLSDYFICKWLFTCAYVRSLTSIQELILVGLLNLIPQID